MSNLSKIFATLAVLSGMFFVSSYVTFTKEEEAQVTSDNSEHKTRPVVELKKIPYEIVERWDIPNGGEGKSIVILQEYVNDSDMTILGETLRRDLRSDKNAFVFIFDDPYAASLRKDILNENMSQKDADFYDTHYVGQYTKNGNTGFHRYSIYLDGVMGTDHKNIEY
jgi:hypothetical protein